MAMESSPEYQGIVINDKAFPPGILKDTVVASVVTALTASAAPVMMNVLIFMVCFGFGKLPNMPEVSRIFASWERN